KEGGGRIGGVGGPGSGGASPARLTRYAMPMSATITSPIQNALKLPAVSPARTLSDAPPSSDACTVSRTCPEFVDVNTFTTSGMMAPASVPQVMMLDSFHHMVPS